MGMFALISNLHFPPLCCQNRNEVAVALLLIIINNLFYVGEKKKYIYIYIANKLIKANKII